MCVCHLPCGATELQLQMCVVRVANKTRPGVRNQCVRLSLSVPDASWCVACAMG